MAIEDKLITTDKKLEETIQYLAIGGMMAGTVVAFASNITTFPGSIYVDDFAHIVAYSFIIAYPIGEKIEQAANSKITAAFGKYFSEITIPLVTAYYIIGETLVNWIPCNVMDENDTYAAGVAGILGFLIGWAKRRLGQKLKINEK